MSVAIPVEALSPDAFAPFGSVLDVPSRAPDIETQNNRYWDGAVPFRTSGVPQVGFLKAFWRPLVVPTMERHLSHTQGFIPLGARPAVFAVAPPGSDPIPDVTRMRAFLLDGTQGVMLHEGTWHHLIFPLVPEAHFALLLQEGTKENDMHVVALTEAVAIRL